MFFCEIGKMGDKMRQIDIEIDRCITKSVPSLSDYISATIQYKDLMKVAINMYCFKKCN